MRKQYIVKRRFVRIVHKHAPPPAVGGEAWLLRVKGSKRLFVATRTLHAVDHGGPETAVFTCDKRGVPTSYDAVLGADEQGRTMTLMEAACLLDDKFSYGRWEL